jgi:hypothetical protein
MLYTKPTRTLGWLRMEPGVAKVGIREPRRPVNSTATLDKPAAVTEIVFCAGCAREISGGAVIVRGTRYCSLECGAAAAVPGNYVG